MTNRIDKKFEELRGKSKKAFIAFITAGFPSLTWTRKLVLAFEQAGVDIVELGIPFSDPLADGPTIQAASQKALDTGVTVSKIWKTVKQIRRKSQIPLALMTYYNPVFHYGQEKFFKKAKQAGVDGLIIPDLPPEEAGDLIAMGREMDLATVFFLSPATPPKRMKKIVGLSTGFVYFVSLTGVTGARRSLPKDLVAKVKAAKALTRKPVCVGFGVSTQAQVRLISRFADGVIVGSAIIEDIQKNIRKPGGLQKTTSFVRSLAKGVR